MTVYWTKRTANIGILTRVTASRKRLVREKRKLTDDQARKLLAAFPAQVRTLATVALVGGLRIHVEEFYRGRERTRLLRVPQSRRVTRQSPLH